MDFITDNYIWFIVIAVVILMAVIGYFAEKTNFGKKDATKTPKKEKVKKEKKEKEVPVLPADTPLSAVVKPTGNNENELGNTLSATDRVMASMAEEMPVTPNSEPDIDESLRQPLTDTYSSQPEQPEEIDPSLATPLESFSSEPVVEENSYVEEPRKEEPASTYEETPYTEDRPQTATESTITNESQNSSVNTEDDDDDVWKF